MGVGLNSVKVIFESASGDKNIFTHRADVALKLSHKGLAESKDFSVRFSFRVKVRTTWKFYKYEIKKCFTFFIKVYKALPFPPPMGRVVRAFLKICSNPKNLMIERLTEGWSRSPPLYGPMAWLYCTRKPRFTCLKFMVIFMKRTLFFWNFTSNYFSTK